MKKNLYGDIFSLAEEIIDQVSLEKKFSSGRKLRVKLGADPTAPDLHLGHALVLRKLCEFQDAGHTAVFIIGDYTAAIGDPSGKTKARPPLLDAEIKKNAKTYFEQVGRIIDLKKAEIHYNSEWFSKMKLAEFLRVVGNFSTNRILDREDFKRRLEQGEEVAHHETLYQIMQAYDSVAVRADVELGGMDQKLNLLAGRELQKKIGYPEQDLVLLPLLIGLDGKHKMSKSLGNYIALTDSADEMVGKIMSIPDSLIFHYAELAAFVPVDELPRWDPKDSKNPRDLKLELAERVAGLYHGKEKARRACENFVKLFSKKDLSNIPSRRLKKKTYTLPELLLEVGFALSKSEARRLIIPGAVEINQQVLKDAYAEIAIASGDIIKVGKRKIFRVA
ncbi:MAG: tyrosine--tRNA ligase [bacterium]|nr:tyrosine--tRNA ligase [bacterium]